MPSRNSVLAWIRIAGYHEDQHTYMRLYTENRISKASADAAFNKGRDQRKAGMSCHCINCKKDQPQ